jgi:hypothetical protein
MFGSFGLPELVLILFAAVLIIWPAARICAKAGYTPWLGVAIVVPGANILLLWFLALADWPRRKASA